MWAGGRLWGMAFGVVGERHNIVCIAAYFIALLKP
jgi:hypothetical protein